MSSPVAQADIPHVRGGVSNGLSNTNTNYGASPRTWGCFLLMQAADRALRDFLMREGGAFSRHRRKPGGASPRTWGCFHLPRYVEATPNVFPTHVGCFPDAHGGRGSAAVFPILVGVFLFVADVTEYTCPHPEKIQRNYRNSLIFLRLNMCVLMTNCLAAVQTCNIGITDNPSFLSVIPSCCWF